MTNTNQLIIFIAILLFLGFISLMLYYHWLGDKLFKRLAEKFPKYYLEIGEPLYYGDALSN